jgi:hypothetical protein
VNQGEREPEGGTFPGRALDTHVTAEPFDNHADDMGAQTQAHTGAAFDLRLRGAVKTLPGALLLLAGQTGPSSDTQTRTSFPLRSRRMHLLALCHNSHYSEERLIIRTFLTPCWSTKKILIPAC